MARVCLLHRRRVLCVVGKVVTLVVSVAGMFNLHARLLHMHQEQRGIFQARTFTTGQASQQGMMNKISWLSCVYEEGEVVGGRG